MLKFCSQQPTYGYLQMTYYIEKHSIHLPTVNPTKKVAFKAFSKQATKYILLKRPVSELVTLKSMKKPEMLHGDSIKILHSGSLSARHNPTRSATQWAAKHSATLTCKGIFISSPVAKNRSFFTEVSKTVYNVYWQSYREVWVTTAQQPHFKLLWPPR